MAFLTDFTGSSTGSNADKRVYNRYQAFSTPGTSTFTVPAGVTKVRATVIGAGGGGGGSQDSNYYGGDGGCGGGFAMGEYTVTPGQAITVTVGSGGSANTNSNGSDGGSSSFGTLASATGGSGGGYRNGSGKSRTPGTASGGTIFNSTGGTGGYGSTNSWGWSTEHYTGGGGGSAGSWLGTGGNGGNVPYYGGYSATAAGGGGIGGAGGNAYFYTNDTSNRYYTGGGGGGSRGAGVSGTDVGGNYDKTYSVDTATGAAGGNNGNGGVGGLKSSWYTPSSAGNYDGKNGWFAPDNGYNASLGTLNTLLSNYWNATPTGNVSGYTYNANPSGSVLLAKTPELAGSGYTTGAAYTPNYLGVNLTADAFVDPKLLWAIGTGGSAAGTYSGGNQGGAGAPGAGGGGGANTNYSQGYGGAGGFMGGGGGAANEAGAPGGNGGVGGGGGGGGIQYSWTYTSQGGNGGNGYVSVEWTA